MRPLPTEKVSVVVNTPSHMPGPSTERVERAWKSTLLSVTGVAKEGRRKEETDTAALVVVGTA